MKDKIRDKFTLFATYLGESEHQIIKSIEWNLEDEHIVGFLTDIEASSSIVVSGYLDIGPFSEYGFNVEDLQQHFYYDQLLSKKMAMKVPAHENMKEEPFYVELMVCDSEILLPFMACLQALARRLSQCALINWEEKRLPVKMQRSKMTMWQL